MGWINDAVEYGFEESIHTNMQDKLNEENAMYSMMLEEKGGNELVELYEETTEPVDHHSCDYLLAQEMGDNLDDMDSEELESAFNMTKGMK